MTEEEMMMRRRAFLLEQELKKQYKDTGITVESINYNVDYVKPSCSRFGKHPRYRVEFSDGSFHEGITCRCTRGCCNTDDISLLHVGDKFANLQDFVDGLSRKTNFPEEEREDFDIMDMMLK